MIKFKGLVRVLSKGEIFGLGIVFGGLFMLWAVMLLHKDPEPLGRNLIIEDPNRDVLESMTVLKLHWVSNDTLNETTITEGGGVYRTKAWKVK
jgi:hypothetical protein